MWRGGPRSAPSGWTSLRTQTSRTKSTTRTRPCRSPQTSTKAVSVQSDQSVQSALRSHHGGKAHSLGIARSRVLSRCHLPSAPTTQGHRRSPTRSQVILRRGLTLTLRLSLLCTTVSCPGVHMCPTGPQSSSSKPSPIPRPHVGLVEELPQQGNAGAGGVGSSPSLTDTSPGAFPSLSRHRELCTVGKMSHYSWKDLSQT